MIIESTLECFMTVIDMIMEIFFWGFHLLSFSNFSIIRFLSNWKTWINFFVLSFSFLEVILIGKVSFGGDARLFFFFWSFLGHFVCFHVFRLKNSIDEIKYCKSALKTQTFKKENPLQFPLRNSNWNLNNFPICRANINISLI